MTRGRLIFPFLAELCRLDTSTMATADPDGTGPLSSCYDPDFKEPVLIDRNDDGIPEPLRYEFPPLLVPCQVEPDAFAALRMVGAGNAPRAKLDLVFHFRDLERLSLVDSTTGDALIRPSDRLSALYQLDGALVQSVRTPPGLYVTEALPMGFGLHRAKPSRNLLVVTFQDRPAARGVQ